jgi:hypothetical protein
MSRMAIASPKRDRKLLTAVGREPDAHRDGRRREQREHERVRELLEDAEQRALLRPLGELVRPVLGERFGASSSLSPSIELTPRARGRRAPPPRGRAAALRSGFVRLRRLGGGLRGHGRPAVIASSAPARAALRLRARRGPRRARPAPPARCRSAAAGASRRRAPGARSPSAPRRAATPILRLSASSSSSAPRFASSCRTCAGQRVARVLLGELGRGLGLGLDLIDLRRHPIERLEGRGVVQAAHRLLDGLLRLGALLPRDEDVLLALRLLDLVVEHPQRRLELIDGLLLLLPLILVASREPVVLLLAVRAPPSRGRRRRP